MKKSALIISTLALALSPVAVFAQQVQTNVQAGSNTAVSVGAGNVTNQNVVNNANQTQFSLDGFGLDPQIQSNVQAGQNQSFTNGIGNVTNQGVFNNANQTQVDLDGYGIPAYPY
ncbi:hypothetical protein STA3757_38730 [Stanieria sp. NIES-3757]|nr:hypothetical protein STA3757_38730 [Stanieria sp. NIES-3757]